MSEIYSVYIKSILSQKVHLTVGEIGNNVKQILEEKIVSTNEGKCIAEGFIKPNSVKILSYSSGVIGSNSVEFQTIYECMMCHPVEGMLIECTSKTITKAGIHAHVIDKDMVIPVTVFVARDHHNTDRFFNSIKENAEILIKVIGIRYELNDPYICVIGKLLEKRIEENEKDRDKGKKGPGPRKQLK